MRHQLEHRAVARAEAEHGDHEQAQGRYRAGQIEAHGGDADRGDGIHRQQAADAADAVGERAAERTHQAASEYAGGGVVAGCYRIEAVLIVEVAGQGACQSEEAAEGHAVEEHEPPAVAIAQRLEVIGQRFGGRALRCIAGDQGEYRQGQDQRDQREAEHVLPAKGGGDGRGEQRGEHGAGVARTGDAHRLALMLRRVPLRSQRQRDGEGRAGHAQ
ncbi:hypothetical protein D3C78_506240 [compost metagenome]